MQRQNKDNFIQIKKMEDLNDWKNINIKKENRNS